MQSELLLSAIKHGTVFRVVAEHSENQRIHLGAGLDRLHQGRTVPGDQVVRNEVGSFGASLL
jgi:hypothetical protein